MSGSVPAVRSDSPSWLSWLTVTVVSLAAILLGGFISLANGAGWVFLTVLGVGLVLAALILPAWAVYGLDETEH